MAWSRFRVVSLLSLSFMVAGSLFFAFAGSAQSFTPDTDLSLADASFRGEDAGDGSGYSVAPAGDVNGDGYDDFLIGAWGNGDGGIMAGQTYLLLETDAAPNAPASPLCEGKTNPTGVSDATPEFSWTFSDPDSGDAQSAYQILVASSSANLAANNGDMWDSGKVISSASTDISYAGSTLTPGDTYYWKVKTWDNHDNEGPYCPEQTFTMNTAPNIPASPLCEGQNNPTGVSDATPEFSWTFSDPDSGDVQYAYLILVASSSANLAANNGDMWDSGTVTSSASNDISYAGSILSPGDTYYWKVKTWDNHGNEGPCCPEQTFTMNTAPNAPVSPLCEGKTNPTGVSDATPEFSWTFSDPDSGDVQYAYQILVASSSANLAANNGDMWDSGKVISAASNDISYAGSTLSPGDTYYWKVKTWDNHGNEGPCCSERTFTMNKAPNIPASPLCEGQTNPTRISDATPEFSWTFSDPDSGDAQSAYQILVASSPANLAANNGDMWDSGKVTGDASTDISYAGSTLTPGDTYYWKVKTWDNHDNEGPCCPEQTFNMNTAPNAPVSPLCEGKTNPTGVSDATPEFSWTFSDPDSGDVQSAYQILVASSSANLAANNGDMWDSGKVTSSASTYISYAGLTLSPGDNYYWKVKTWDNHGKEGPCCPEQTFTMNTAPNAPASPLCEGKTNPTGVSDATPEFSWTFSDPDNGDAQSAYQILVASSSANLAANNGDMWDSGKVTSNVSTDISYAGSTLSWLDNYYWKVKTWDNHGGESPYCSEQTFAMSAAPAPGGLSGTAIVGIAILSCIAVAAISFAASKWRRSD